jgi:hypothetical protein
MNLFKDVSFYAVDSHSHLSEKVGSGLFYYWKKRIIHDITSLFNDGPIFISYSYCLQ